MHLDDSEYQSLLADALRYRWLRDMPKHPYSGVYFPWSLPDNKELWIPGEWMTGERLDASIDMIRSDGGRQPYWSRDMKHVDDTAHLPTPPANEGGS